MFTYKMPVLLEHTDAAGIVYFVNNYKFAHAAYEMWLDKHGHSLFDLIQNEEYFLPIVHSEADFKAPISLNDRIEINLVTERIGQTSYTIKYKVSSEGEIKSVIQTVHACISVITKEKLQLPRTLHDILQQNLE